LSTLLSQYHVYARHGDIYDSFNFNQDRDRASIGDVFAVEILNRFAYEAARKFMLQLPAPLLASLSELVNVRPALATPLWISSQLRQNEVPEKDREALKDLWDGICRDFLELDPVRKADKKRKLDLVDWFKLGITVTDTVSFKTLDDLVVWVRKKFWPDDEIKFSTYALKEKAFQEEAAQFIVYGHTHHHEVVPLDDIPAAPVPTSQLYMNCGTWHTYFDLAIYKPREQKFVPYQVLSYLTFFAGDERGGRRFETWSGAFSE
jgi:UDP-2,3-diacylglucosamine pyrophosphatase LpxH